MRRQSRRDETEAPIVNALRAMGYQVERALLTDLLIRDPKTGRIELLEVTGITKYRKRDEKQLQFLRTWQVPMVKTLDEALRALGSRIL